MSGCLHDQIERAVRRLAASPPGYRIAFAVSSKEVGWAVTAHLHKITDGTAAVINGPNFMLPGDRVLKIVRPTDEPRAIEVNEFDHDRGLSRRRYEEMELRERLPTPIDRDGWVKLRFLGEQQ